MPFSHVAAAYQPEQLAKLTEAFHRVWPRVFLANGGYSDDEFNRLQQKLANYLLACASRGEFDPDILEEHVCRALLKRDKAAA